MSLIKNVKNPISLARTVMEKTKHNYLVGESAEKLAAKEKLERMENSYFSTDKRKEQLLKAQESDAIVNDHDLEEKKVSENKIRIVSKIEKNKISNSTILEKLLNLSEMENTDFEKTYERKSREEEESEDGFTDDENETFNEIDGYQYDKNENENVEEENIKKFQKTFDEDINSKKEKEDPDLVDSMFPGSTGTVGCVCMLHGHVAAATSTGGLTNKMAGRIGENFFFFYVFIFSVLHNFLFFNNSFYHHYSYH